MATVARRELDSAARAPIVTEAGVLCWNCRKVWLLTVAPGTSWECPRCGARNHA